MVAGVDLPPNSGLAIRRWLGETTKRPVVSVRIAETFELGSSLRGWFTDPHARDQQKAAGRKKVLANHIAALVVAVNLDKAFHVKTGD